MIEEMLSIVCYLNNEDWKPENGGELVIYLPNNEGEEGGRNLSISWTSCYI